MGSFSKNPHVLIQAKEVSFAYGDTPVFTKVSFAVEAGEKVAISGRNGSGKSHLLDCLAGVRLVSGGSLQVVGELDFLSSSDSFAFNFTVSELLSFVPGVNTASACRVASQLGFDMTGWVQRGVLSLSSGERQLVRLLCTLSKEKDLYLLDEPEVHLDAYTREKLASYLQNHSSAFVVVTHDNYFRQQFASKTISMPSM